MSAVVGLGLIVVLAWLVSSTLHLRRVRRCSLDLIERLTAVVEHEARRRRPTPRLRIRASVRDTARWN